jgi:hypothetical protein
VQLAASARALTEDDFPHEQFVQQEQDFLAGARLAQQAQPVSALFPQAQEFLALQQVLQHLLLHAHACFVLQQSFSQAQAFLTLQQPLSQAHDFFAAVAA